MPLSVRDERVDELLERRRSATLSGSWYRNRTLRIGGGDSSGGVERCLRIERARQVVRGTQLDDGVQDALRDGARLGVRVPVADVAEEAGEVRERERAEDLVDGGVAGDRGGRRVLGGGERGEEGVQAAGLGHAEREEDRVAVVVEGEVVGEVLLPVNGRRYQHPAPCEVG